VFGLTPGLETEATVRFSGQPKSGKISGKIRIPKTSCNYVEINSPFVHTKFGMSVSPANTDLKGGGKSCAAILQGDGLTRSVYLGEPSSGDLPRWKPTGSMSFLGNVVDTPDFYECSYQITGLPDVGIYDFAIAPGTSLAKRLTADIPFHGRYLDLHALGKDALFDHAFHLASSPSTLDIGHKGAQTAKECPVESTPGRGLSPSEIAKILGAFDPNKCPSCGIQQKPGEANVIVITNLSAFAKTLAGSVIAPRLNGIAAH
jgi:hypothetical protein